MVFEPTPLSANNPRIAELRRLTGRRRARLEAGAFVLEGPVPVGELLTAGAPVTELYVDGDAWAVADDRSALRAAVRAAFDADVPVWSLASSVFASVSDTATPQGVLALAPRRPMAIDELSSRPGPVLVLVDVADPGNAGTLIRTAEAAGCAGVVVCGSTTDPFGPKSVRAAAGSIVRLPVAEVTEVGDVIAALAERTIVGTVVGGGVAPEAVDLSVPVALLIGSEAHGLSGEVTARCDSLVTIPMAPTVESINAATAGAVLLFEAARQRRAR